MRTRTDACKHLLCVHNAAKYSLDFFSPLKNFLLNCTCMPFPQDAKVPCNAFVVFEGHYLFFNKYFQFCILTHLIYQNINETATSYCSCIWTSWFELLQPSGFRIWWLFCRVLSPASFALEGQTCILEWIQLVSHEQIRKQDQATDEKRETVLDRDLFFFLFLTRNITCPTLNVSAQKNATKTRRGKVAHRLKWNAIKECFICFSSSLPLLLDSCFPLEIPMLPPVPLQ